MIRVYGCFHCGGSEYPSVTYHILYTTLYNVLESAWLCKKCLKKLHNSDPIRVHSGLNYLDKHINAATGDNATFSLTHAKRN